MTDMYTRAAMRIRRDIEAIQAIPEHEYIERECVMTDDEAKEERQFFDNQHNNQSAKEQIAEEDRRNLEELKSSDTEIFSFVRDYLIDDDDFDKLILCVLNSMDGALDQHNGFWLRMLIKKALPEYLSAVRKS